MHSPASDNYEEAIRETVEQTLREYQRQSDTTHVVLVRIEWMLSRLATSAFGKRL